MKTPLTPGEILLEKYLEPMGIWSPRQPISAALRLSVGCRGNLSSLRFGSQNALGRALGVSPRSINEIVLGRRAIRPEMSLTRGRFFKVSGFANVVAVCCRINGFAAQSAAATKNLKLR